MSQSSPNQTNDVHDVAGIQQLSDFFTATRNEIIGHEYKKAAAIENGICAKLVEALRPLSGHESFDAGSGAQQRRPSTERISTLSDHDQLRLQAVFIANSLANAGTAYIAPLVAAGILQPLLDILSSESTPTRLNVESLRTLVTIASRLRNEPLDTYRSVIDTVFNAIISPQSPNVHTLTHLLRPDWNAPKAQEQFILTLQLIDYIAYGSDSRRKILVSGGVLDLLAFTFAAWLAGNQGVFRSNDADLRAAFPEYPPRNTYKFITRAVASVIGESAYRTSRFLICKDMLTVFPETADLTTSDIQSHNEVQNGQPHTTSSRQWDSFLPKFPSQLRSDSVKDSFSSVVSDRPPKSTVSNAIAWFIHMARSTIDEERIVTLYLLSIILKNTGANVRYEKHLSKLIVPLLTQDLKQAQNSASQDKLMPLHGIRELIVSLQHTIANCGGLQSAASESKALELLCLLLKKTFDHVDDGSQPKMWSANADESYGDTRAMHNPLKLGPPGSKPQTARVLYIRAGSMLALAALAEKEDKFRKGVIDSGVMQHIVDSVRPRPNVNPNQKQYAPSIVLTAAMELLVTLSRSVGMLRTSLIDAKVALPVLELAKHEDVDIKLHATDVLTNMLLQFSPMKEELIKNDAHILLCEYAHSTNTSLRISALWALKHLVVQVSNTLKIEVLQQLGPTFLMSLLNNEASTPKKHLAIPDILNDEPSMEVDGPVTSSDTTKDHDDEIDAFGADLHSEFGPPIKYLALLQPLRTSEENVAARQRRDGIYIQHHVLDLIRNMLAEPTDQHPELVDQVLNLLGASRFFDFVISKFKPKSTATPHSSNGATSGKQPRLTVPGNMGHIISSTPTFIDGDNYCHPDILHSACFVLAHIANGRPAHKNMVIAQPQMLSSLLPHFLHPSVPVRIGCLWIVCNILWVESGADSKAGRQRALEMRRSGIEERCRELLADNSSMDVQERAKYVAEGFTKLLGQPHLAADRVWTRE